MRRETGLFQVSRAPAPSYGTVTRRDRQDASRVDQVTLHSPLFTLHCRFRPGFHGSEEAPGPAFDFLGSLAIESAENAFRQAILRLGEVSMRTLARRLTLLVFAIVAVVLGSTSAIPALAVAEEEERKQNPYKGNPDDILVGKGLFRYYCAGCHGMEGGGGFRGPDLVRGQLTHVVDDHDMLEVVRNGIQGTQMPPQTLPDSNLWRMIAFITDLRSKARPQELSGDWESGREIFNGKGFCSGCHMVRGEGGRFGPDLTGLGNTRPWESFREAMREPSAQFKNVLQADGRMAGGYESVRLVTPAGEEITGCGPQRGHLHPSRCWTGRRTTTAIARANSGNSPTWTIP